MRRLVRAACAMVGRSRVRRSRPSANRLSGGFFRDTSGQTAVEFALIYAAVILPLTFGIVFVAEVFWVWHSVVDFSREGAKYAATHCYQADGGNVIDYMRGHVPRMIDMDQFQTGQAEISVQYLSRDPDTGAVNDFTCSGSDCTVDCVPDAVTVRISNYEFRRFFTTYLKLPGITLPDFRATIPIESVGCDVDGSCLP